MRNVYFAAIGLSVLLVATAANAAGSNSPECVTLGDKVKTALAANQQSANYDQAVKESHYGRDFCANSMPKVGADHYTQALKLLGVS